MTTTPPTPAVGYLTETQRRRAQALVIARQLFPNAPHQDAHRIARWIITGKTTS